MYATIRLTALLGLATACAAQAQTTTDLAGKTLVMGEASLQLRPNGVLGGTTGKDRLTGAWTVRDGRFCRTIQKPERLAGTQCMTFEVKGSKASFRRDDGKVLVYDVK